MHNLYINMCVTHAENTFYKGFWRQRNKSKFIFVLYIAEHKDIRHKCNCVENSVWKSDLENKKVLDWSEFQSQRPYTDFITSEWRHPLCVGTYVLTRSVHPHLIQSSDQHMHSAYQRQVLSLDARDIHETEKRTVKGRWENRQFLVTALEMPRKSFVRWKYRENAWWRLETRKCC